MDLRREEKKRKNLFYPIIWVKKHKGDIKGALLLIGFFIMVYAVRSVTPSIAQFILMLDASIISTFFDFILLSLFLIPILKSFKEEK